MSNLKWTRKTTEKIAEELKELGIQVSPNTLAKLLKVVGFSLRVNQKKIPASSVTPQIRDEQFAYIAEKRKSFAYQNAMVISVDTKKKELVGCFLNDGQTLSKQPIKINDHDFRFQSQGIAIPYGIFDIQANRGSVVIGTSIDTSWFATDCLVFGMLKKGKNSILMRLNC